MRAPGIGFTWALMLFAASVANAAPPAAPQVTMGADIKLLRFDWEPVPGATLLPAVGQAGRYSMLPPLGERIPASVTQAEHAIPVHLQDWTRMRYVVTACNSDGCTNSAALNPRSRDARHHRLSQSLEHRRRRHLRSERGSERRRVHTRRVRRERGQQCQRRQRRSDRQQLTRLRRRVCLSTPRQHLATGGLSQGRRESARQQFCTFAPRGSGLERRWFDSGGERHGEDVNGVLERRRRVHLSARGQCLEPHDPAGLPTEAALRPSAFSRTSATTAVCSK